VAPAIESPLVPPPATSGKPQDCPQKVDLVSESSPAKSSYASASGDVPAHHKRYKELYEQEEAQKILTRKINDPQDERKRFEDINHKSFKKF